MANKRTAVGLFGWGRSNAGVMNYLSKNGNYEFLLRSDRECAVPRGISAAYFGSHAFDDLRESVLYLAPSVRRDRRDIAGCADMGIKLSSDAELFFSLAKCDVYAVTGSSGKSTTTHLISAILNAAGTPCVAAGNYGASLAMLIGSQNAVAAELSSFQLTYCKPRSKRAVITNIVPNHLDWHTDMDEYAEAKLAVANGTEGLIIDADSRLLTERVHTPLFAAVSDTLDRAELSRILPAESYFTLDGRGRILLNGHPFADTSSFPRRERHNIKNFMLAAAATLGVASPEICSRVFTDFTGLCHRNEAICDVFGIRFYDSSIDTSPDRALATLSSYTEPPIAIICGKSKGADYGELAKKLPTLTRGAIFMGEVGRAVMELLPTGYTRYMACETMKDAVRRAFDMAREAGCDVVLCPAGTSYDKYASFEERGDDFKKEARALHEK